MIRFHRLQLQIHVLQLYQCKVSIDDILKSLLYSKCQLLKLSVRGMLELN